MKYFSYYLFFSFSSVIVTRANEVDPHKLVAVSEYEVAAYLYSKLRAGTKHAEEPPPMSPSMRNRICHYITGSTFFKDVLHEERVYIYEMYDTIMNSDPDLFSIFFGPSLDPMADMDTVYLNLPRLMDVFLNIDDDEEEATQEYVFSCLTKDSAGKLSIYHISGEYNFSDTNEKYIPGRFIFYGYLDDDRTMTDVFVVAEVPARSLSAPGTDVERVYLQKRGANKPAEDKRDDPMCKLSESERLRMCNIILTSAYFEGELKFRPQFRNDDPLECVKRVIWFEDEDVRFQARWTHYDEWMISCRTEQYYATYQAEYFLSRVYDVPDEVFVYRWAEEDDSKIVIENLFGNVRFQL